MPPLSDTTLIDDNVDPTVEVVFSFSKGLRPIISKSTLLGLVRGSVRVAFTSKYSAPAAPCAASSPASA